MGFQETFKALSDPTRREILLLLRKGKLSAGEIGEHFNLTGATLSHHLSTLKQAELVSDQKEGKYIYYELNTSVVEDLLAWITRLMEGDRHEE
mgnify:CR=1 FL=1